MRIWILTSIFLLGLTAPAAAQGFGSFGVRAGAGIGFNLWNGDESPPEDAGIPVPLAVGPAWQLDLMIATFEIDLLYRQEPQAVAGTGVEYVQHRLSLPLLMKINLPGLSFLHTGVGIEPRLLLATADNPYESADDILESLVWYAPIVLGANVDLGGFVLDIESRFEFQLSNHYVGPQADATRTHQLMLFVGGFF